MSLSVAQVETAAPDQASLKAASKLMKPAKWPLRGVNGASGLVWGECQGSGANPYRVMADSTDLGAKCTCPSRKFPCKHSLALLWMYAEDSGGFGEGAVPDWVSDWVGRRRGPTAAKGTAPPAPKKSIVAATRQEPEPEADTATLAKRAAAASKRRASVVSNVQSATLDLEQWIGDQLRAGLPAFLNETTDRCRRIAARMVDAKAQALAGRIDGIPARLAVLSSEERVDAAIAELGKLVLLVRAWRQTPDDPDLNRAVVSAETREQVLGDPDAPTVRARWEVVGERISTGRDGLVSQATWLLEMGEGRRFALLLDFFPAHLGKRAVPFTPGEQFEAVLKFYPGRHPLRALIAERGPSGEGHLPWPVPAGEPPLHAIPPMLDAAPWMLSAPVMLPAGRICAAVGGPDWWQSETGEALPLTGPADAVVRGLKLRTTAALWTGMRLDPLATQTDHGRLGFDG